MARKAKASDATRSNGYDKELLQDYLGRIEELQDEIASIKASNAAKCRAKLEDIGLVYADAKARGVPTKPLKTMVKIRSLQRKTTETIARLSGDDASEFEQMTKAIGDFGELPLGQAALQRAAANDAGSAALDSFTS